MVELRKQIRFGRFVLYGLGSLSQYLNVHRQRIIPYIVLLCLYLLLWQGTIFLLSGLHQIVTQV